MVTELHKRLVAESRAHDVGELSPVEDSLVFDVTDLQAQLVQSLNVHMEARAENRPSLFQHTSDDKVMSEDDFAKIGLELIREGKVAVVILAGGQGTRLGFDHPKGLFEIGVPSKRNIFHILIDRVMRIQMVAHGSDEVLLPEH